MTTKTKTNESKNMSNNNETKVMCPVCGSEFVIGEHEHTVKNATVVGADSGLGAIYLPVSKRGNALKAAGIDTSKYFSIMLPTGSEQMMKMDEDGRAVPVTDDDPILQTIVKGGTIPNRNLFRRWIMSQMFHGLESTGGFNGWLVRHGYMYQWEMIVEELRVQAKLYGKDIENFNARNRWFNKDLVVAMARDYITQMRKDAMSRPTHKCKGVPYITFDRRNIFVVDIDSKLVAPIQEMVQRIEDARTPQRIYEAARHFYTNIQGYCIYYKQCPAWKDAYKGMGAYATMQNLLRFHGCKFPKDNDFYKKGLSGLQMLEDAAIAYDDEGWRLLGLMKQMIEENGINISAKMTEWARAKEAKRTA